MRKLIGLLGVWAAVLIIVPGSSTKAAEPKKIIVGVYFLQNGEYVEQPQELEFELVGEGECYEWHRTAQPDDANPDGPHEHYNAAGDMTYDGTIFWWTEYGPEHEEGAAEARCLDRDRPWEPKKWANWDDYFEEDHGPNLPTYYLQIKDVE